MTMVLYAYLQRHRLLWQHPHRVVRGFSLLELVLVLFVLGILAAVMTPAVRDVVETSQREAELRTLDEIVKTITASFENTDLSQFNLAALPGTIGASDPVTVFSSSTSQLPVITTTNDWFAKVARLRGITPQIGAAPSAAVQPELARLVFNAVGNPRLLIAAPNETGQQRFLLMSLIGRSEQLSLPAYETNDTWFDAIWNHDWESVSAPLPGLWQNLLTPAQAAAWSTVQAGITRVHQLCVRRIVLPKFRITVNNNHPTEAAFVSFNNTTNVFTASANSGANVSPEILAGRLITIHRGTSLPGVESLRFHLKENTTVTLQ